MERDSGSVQRFLRGNGTPTLFSLVRGGTEGLSQFWVPYPLIFALAATGPAQRWDPLHAAGPRARRRGVRGCARCLRVRVACAGSQRGYARRRDA